MSSFTKLIFQVIQAIFYRHLDDQFRQNQLINVAIPSKPSNWDGSN